MNKLYSLAKLLAILLIFSNRASAADFYFNVPVARTFQEVAASQGADCNASYNSCTFILGSDGMTISPNATITFTNGESCTNCTFYTFYDNTDRVVIASNVTFNNLRLVGSYLVVQDGYTVTLAGDINLYTHNAEPDQAISTIVIGNSALNTSPSAIDLNGHNINIYSPLPPMGNAADKISTIILSETSSSIYDHSSLSNGQVNYYYSPITVGTTYTYLFNQNLFSANGGTGTNPGTTPIPYDPLANGKFQLVGPSKSLITLGGATSTPVTAAFISSLPLPVILIDFNADLRTDGTVNVVWSTAQELNADHFEVLRSANGSEWKVLGTVAAKGNSNALVDYSYIDLSPAIGVDSYRLQIVDVAGNLLYSATKNVKNNAEQSLSIFPNPARDNVNLYLGAATSSDLTLRFIDISGKVLQSQVIGRGTSMASIAVSSFPVGVYVLQLSNSSGTIKTAKIIVTR
jgi:hypothetical protein